MDGRQSTARIGWGLAAVVMLLAAIAPALWNGFPIIFPDTGGYLERPLIGTLELGRSALYGTILLAGLPLDFWPSAIAQAALTVWLVVMLLRAHGLARPWFAAMTVIGLAIATGMPWFASTLIPDILLPDAVIALYLLAFHRLRRAEIIALVVVVAIAIASHMGTLALSVGLVAAFALARFVPLVRPRLDLPACATALGLLLAPVSNLAITGQFAFTPGGETFLFGRLVEDGIVARYLKDRCPDATIRLCAFKDKMPTSADDWLWAPGGPIGDLGGWRGYRPEARRIIGDTLRLYPALHAETAALTTLKQLAMMRTEVSTKPDWIAPALESLERQTPNLMPRLKASHQIASPATVDRLVATLNVVHVPVAILSIVGLLGAVVASRRLRVESHGVVLAAAVLLAIAGNAAICGIFSNPVDRYQSRLVWIAPLALIVVAASRKMPSTKVSA